MPSFIRAPRLPRLLIDKPPRLNFSSGKLFKPETPEVPYTSCEVTSNMAKRAAEEDKPLAHLSLKKGERPNNNASDKGGQNPDEEFEDEFEDEFESEDELFEAGVDGRPDTEREAEEKGMWIYL